MKLRNICAISFILLITFTASAFIPGKSSAAPVPEVNFLNKLTQGIKTPTRIAVDLLNNVYVADGRSGILKFNHDGQFIATISGKSPKAIAATNAGDLAASYGDHVAVLDSTTGAEKFKLGKGAGQFKQASGIVVDNEGIFYVVDSIDNCVQIFAQSGSPIITTTSSPGKPTNSFGSKGNQNGQFDMPGGISFEKIGEQIAVADTLNGRIQFFDRDGKYIRTLGAKGSGPLLFTSPRSITFEYSKSSPPVLARIYVVDSFQSDVQIIDPEDYTVFIGSIGGYGLTPGKLVSPSDVGFIQASSRLLVANGLGDISVYGINVKDQPVPDITPPLLTLNQLPATVSSNQLTISGTVESDATVSVITSTNASIGPVTTSAISPGSNFWSAQLTSLASGSNAITVIATDTSANTTVISTSVIFNQTAVKVTINPVTTPTNSSTQVISGTMDSGATVALSSSTAASFGQVTFPTASTWQAQVSNLEEGSNAITATASNNTTSAAATTIITLVRTPPDLNVSSLPSGSITSEPLLNISGYVQTGSYFDQLTVNGITAPVVNDLFGATINLNPGDNVITIQATDKAGNSSSESRTISYLPQRPAITITAPADGLTVDALTMAVSGTAPLGSTVTLQLYNGSANGLQFTQLSQPTTTTTWQTTQPLPLDPGINTIIATVTDKTGATAQAKVTVNNDSTVPQLVIDTPSRDIAVNRTSFSLHGKTDGNAAITADINGNSVPVAMDENGNFTLSSTLNDIGTYTITVTATNAVGNSTTAFRSIIYDLTPPTLTVDSLSPLKVTAQSGTLTATDRNGPVNGAVVTFNPDFSSTIDLSNATYDPATLDIHAVDGAGNSSRNGDLDGNGSTDITDVVLAMRASVGLDQAEYAAMLRGDVAPLANGGSTPDGLLDIFDVVYIMEKIVGLR